MGLTVILNLCTLICQLIILATFIRSENELTKKCIPFDCKAFAKAVAVANCDKD